MIKRHRVPVDSEIKRFENHITLQDNIRILFSSPFGAGKSSFLEYFFSEHNNYLTVKLFPTNYSVASNKDIFELIKYDLLTSIFEHFSEHLDLDKEDFNGFIVGQMYALHKMDFYSLSQSVIKAFIPVAKPFVEMSEEIKKLYEKYNDFKDEINRDDEDFIIDYLTSLRMQAGSIYEQDFFTKKIIEYLNQIRKKTKKEIVLIIDDMDRLDAEHVFRIFNIFTAHYDSKHDKNKFGFDKLILVCDINSVEHLFFHRYGSKAEFNGYIDKFYSHYIFQFDNKKYLIESITNLIRPKETLFKYYPPGAREDFSRYYQIDNTNFYTCFHYVISKFIEIDEIKIRNFQRFQEYSLPNLRLANGSERQLDSDYYYFIVLIHLLCQFFPRAIDLENAIYKLSENYSSDYDPESRSYFDDSSKDDLFIQFTLPFLVTPEKIHGVRREETALFKNEFKTNIVIVYTESHNLSDGGIKYLRCLTSLTSIDHKEGQVGGPIIPRPNPYWFLYQAFLECKKRRYSLRFMEF